MLDIKHIRTAAYHQSSNGQAERYVQTVKNSLESNYCNNKTFKERLFDFLTSYRSTPHTVTNQMPAEMFIGRNIRTRFDLIKPYLILGVNSNPHKNNLTLCTLSPNNHVIVRRYGSKQKWQHGKIVEKHMDQIKKSQTIENSTKDDIWDNIIPLTEPTLNNSPGKRYPMRNRKHVLRYGFED